MTDGWIVIPGWARFQHYHDRDPAWIKNYLDQLDRDEYLELSFAQRGLLEDLRKLYARRRGVVRGDTSRLSRALHGKVSEKSLQALNHAGFIEFSASKPLALAHAPALAREKEKEKEPPKPPADAGGRKRKERKTGYRFVRGTHSGTYVRDPNGTDTPPYAVPSEGGTEFKESQ